MKINKNISILLFLIYILYSLNIFGKQLDNDKSQFYDYGKKFYYETIVFPGNTIDSIDITILFKVSYSLLLFQKTTDNNFYSKPHLEFEYKNSQGIIKKRSYWTDSIIITKYEDAKNKMNFRYGFITVRVPNDDYNLFLQARNQDNSIFIKQMITQINRINYSNKIYISKPLFLYQEINNTNISLHPFILNGNIPFTSKTSRMIIITKYNKSNSKFQYIISNITENEKKSVWGEYINFTGQSIAEDAIINISIEDNSRNIDVDFDNTKKYDIKDTNINFGILNIELFSEQLVPGKYDLILINNDTKDTINIKFEVEWENIPLSLKKPKYAANLMYYILNDSEYDAINSGSENEILRKIIEYWKKNDPTPFSPYNEAMIEYFNRVDYAFFNFQTVSEKDGAKTDRGKIYILYGPPDSIERRLEGSHAIEIWQYKKLNKEFIFQTKSTGVYKLIKIND